MELRSGGIVLRPAVVGDAGEVVAAVRASLAELRPWMTWAHDGYDVSSHHEFVTTSAQRGDRPLMICERSGEIIGCVGLNQVDHVNRSANLGYWVRSDRTGRGVATTATVLLARWAVDGLGLRRIEIVMSVENGASRAVAERVGAHHEGVLRSALELQGRRHDAHLYSLLAAEVRAWPAPEVDG